MNALAHYERCVQFCERRMMAAASRRDKRSWFFWFDCLSKYHSLRSAAR